MTTVSGEGNTNPTSTTEVTDYTLHGKNIVHLTKGADSLHFYYDAQNRPAIVLWHSATGSGTYAYIYDLQGDVIGLLDSSGTEVVRYAYNDYGLPAMRTGTLADTLGLLNPFRYRGYVYDDETQLYYLRSRYYNPYRGRFINADSVFDGANLFCYCGNEPVNKSDIDGRTMAHVSCCSYCYGLDTNGRKTIEITDRLNAEMSKARVEMLIYLNFDFAFALAQFVLHVRSFGKWDLKHRTDWQLSNDYVVSI